jgi:hypothetical protein
MVGPAGFEPVFAGFSKPAALAIRPTAAAQNRRIGQELAKQKAVRSTVNGRPKLQVGWSPIRAKVLCSSCIQSEEPNTDRLSEERLSQASLCDARRARSSSISKAFGGFLVGAQKGWIKGFL